MKKELTLLVARLALISLLIGGCAGATARREVLAPAVLSAWPGVKSDAERGIRARVEDGEVSVEAAESLTERLRAFEEALGRLR